MSSPRSMGFDWIRATTFWFFLKMSSPLSAGATSGGRMRADLVGGGGAIAGRVEATLPSGVLEDRGCPRLTRGATRVAIMPPAKPRLLGSCMLALSPKNLCSRGFRGAVRPEPDAHSKQAGDQR